jgi:hypothetical protein
LRALAVKCERHCFPSLGVFRPLLNQLEQAIISAKRDDATKPITEINFLNADRLDPAKRGRGEEAHEEAWQSDHDPILSLGPMPAMGGKRTIPRSISGDCSPPLGR